MKSWIAAYNRRTHGAYRTEDEAKKAAHDLMRLLNGIPVGYRMVIMGKMGAFALVTLSLEPSQ